MLSKRNIRHNRNGSICVREKQLKEIRVGFSGQLVAQLGSSLEPALALLLRRVGLEATANLVVAALDLKLVQLLRDAIRTADISGGKLSPRGALPFIVEDRFLPRHVHEPEPRFEPRPVIHPTPRFEPRPVIHPTVRVEPKLAAAAPECCHTKPCPGPLAPPWRQPVWEIPVPPPPILKMVRYRPDMRHKGSLIDTFI